MPLLISGSQSVPYEIRFASRAKHLSIAVNWRGDCRVVVPSRRRLSPEAIQAFVLSQSAWIFRQVLKQKKNSDKIPLNHRGLAVGRIAENTRDLLARLLSRHGAGYSYRTVKVRAYKSRWGSCDRNGRLCFHSRLSLLPESLAEYIVIHELCHTRHLNHSRDFWAAVECACPDYQDRRRALKKYLL